MRISLSNPEKYWWWLAGALAIVLIRALFITVMDVDASQYASISMEMLQNDSWLQVQHRHSDYLDKPPLLFWLSATAFSGLGLSTWAYKLPSFLAALLGVWAVYRFCKNFYDETTGHYAAWILASSVGFFLLCNDVRTDTLLMGFSTAAIWQMATYLHNQRMQHLFWAALCTGLAMLAKGPIGLIAVMAATGSHVLLTGNWRAIFKWQWLLFLLIIAAVLAPMCYGLYQQFDIHPEKIINDRTGVSGLYFYFWEQSFGRITGENVWKNDTTGFYFLHVMAWAFLPWILWLAYSLLQSTRQLIQHQRIGSLKEGYAAGAFLLLFIALSQSSYKLPHYIFIVLPWAAVLTARAVPHISIQRASILAWGNFMLVILASLAILLIPVFVFPTLNPFIWIPALILAGFATYQTFPQKRQWIQRFQGHIALGILIGFVMHFHYYPQLMPYQSSSTAGHWISQQQIPSGQLARMGSSGHALDFYSGQIIPYYDTPEKALEHLKRTADLWIYVREGGREQLDAAQIPYTEEAAFQHFQPALMKAGFLNPATRDRYLSTAYILRLKPD